MRIISFITVPATIQRILVHPYLVHRPPDVSPAPDPNQVAFDLGQSHFSISQLPSPSRCLLDQKSRPTLAFPSLEGVWISCPSTGAPHHVQHR